MTGLSLLLSIIIGAIGGLFCSFTLGGPELLATFAPKDWKGALRLLAALAIGALGGVIAGGVFQFIAGQAQGGGESTTGGIVGAVLGLFLLPLTAYGLYHLLEYRLQQAKDDGTTFGQRVMRTGGCVIVALAPLGLALGAWLGASLGSGSFALGSIIVPFAGGVALLLIPLMIWISFHTEEMPQRGRLETRESSACHRPCCEARQQRLARLRSPRWQQSMKERA